ncbi:TetR/AcrR family transcriptional regulator [Kingella oralis]|uniref:Transcriptional regulator, TetR family n=1 Tax=Kingella oralis ATCC 51147 TaxID=629741 RepID=C4GED1_9NEIS|nr:TetR/AcrR family transcriptional regulator [Kingella oralis]EEP69541.1 transcriptional regulator, TetR family [Kingella oralis ATCC 51147]QMT42798.1 TetR/AcrR family transcriptional regulator [Kingella oralis]
MSLDFSSSQQFIRAAERLYPQLGYQKLSVRALAAQAQLSSGLFHHLFANKDDFMAQVFAQHFQRAFGWLAPEFAADAPPLERLRRLYFQAALSLRNEVPWITRMMIDSADNVATAQQSMQDLVLREFHIVRQMVREIAPQLSNEQAMLAISQMQTSILLPILAANTFSRIRVVPDELRRPILQQLTDEALAQRVDWMIKALFSAKETQ